MATPENQTQVFNGKTKEKQIWVTNNQLKNILLSLSLKKSTDGIPLLPLW